MDLHIYILTQLIETSKRDIFIPFTYKEGDYMIKKGIWIITIFISIILGYLSFVNMETVQYYQLGAIQDYISIQENKETIMLWSQFQEGYQQEGVNSVVDYCQNHNLTMLLVAGDNKGGIHFSDYYLYTQQSDILNGLNFTNKRQSIDFSQYNTHEYYTTYQDDQEYQGLMVTVNKEFFNNFYNQYRIHNFYKVEDIIKDKGNQISLFIYSNHRESLLNDMNDVFLKGHVSYQDLTDGYSPAQLIDIHQENNMNMIKIMVILIFIVGLLLILYLMKLKRQIIIMRLNGLSILRIMQKKLGGFLFVELIVFITSLLICMFINAGKLDSYNREYYQLFIKYFVMFVGLIIVLCIMIYIFIYINMHLKYLKKEYQIKHFAEINVFLKVVIISLLMFPFIEMIETSKDSIIQYKGIMDNKDLIDQSAYFDSDLDTSETTEEVFNYYLKNGGFYIDFDYYQNHTREYLLEVTPEKYHDEIDEMAIDYPFLLANANYLKNQNIKDENGNILDLSKFQEDVLLVPKEHKKKNLKKIMEDKDYQIIYVEKIGNCFNIKLNQPYYLSNPVIHLVTHKSDRTRLYYMNLLIKDKSIQDYQNEVKQMTNETVEMFSNEVISSVNINSIQKTLQETLSIIILYITLISILIYQITYIYISENQMSIALSYMNGCSYKERYKELYMYSTITYLSIFVIGIVILKGYFLDILIFNILGLGFELIVLYCFIKKFESSNIANILKGESRL